MGRKKQNTEFVKEIFELTKGDYIFLEEYKGHNSKIKVKHSCGFEYEVTPKNFLFGKRCPQCAHLERSKSQRNNIQNVKKRIFEVHGDEYTLLSEEYINNKTKMKFLHKSCGRVFESTANKIMSGRGCNYCFGIRKATHEEFIKKFRDVEFSEEYTLLEEYKNSRTKILTHHNVCGTEFLLDPHHFLREVGYCPTCSYEKNNSKGVKKIRKWLDKHNFKYEVEKYFEKCIHKKMLPFDFFIESLKTAIEYDGEFHFKPFGKDEMELEMTKLRDSIKDTFCRENDITLIRIPYNEYKNIYSILNEKLLSSSTTSRKA